MNDNDSKPPRRQGARPGGARGSEGRRSDRPAAKKPFAKRRDEGGEKPRGDFAGKGKPWAKRDAAAGDGKRPFAKRPRPASDRPASDRPGSDRPASERADSPRADRKPFVKREDRKPFGERTDRQPSGGRPERKPFREGAERPPFRERKAFDGHQERKPFDKDKERKPFRADAERKPFGVRPERKPFREGAERPPFREHKAFDDRQERKPFDTDTERKPFRDDTHGKPFKRPDRGDSDRAFKSRAEPEEPAGERIAKRLARAGIASRRDAEELIAAGRVKVNGKALSSPAINVLASDVIHLDDTEIPPIERTRLFLFNKPAGLVTTNRDPEGRKTVFDVLPADLPRLMTIGRLDINTEGLLLLTNDGGLSRVLELPATGWLRRYRARVHGRVDEQALAGLKDGIAVDGAFYGAIEASLERTQGTNAWLTIGLREGKNREVKNILGALGLEVTRLIRISYGPFQLGELLEGHVMEVKGRTLRDQLGERLIEESGANFDADIVKPFSNKPVRRVQRPDEAERPKFSRDGDHRPIGEGGLIKNRKRRENSRDEALGKLSTRPERPKFERGERPKFDRGEKPARTAKFGERPDRYATFAAKPGADKPEPRPRAGKKSEREQRPIEPPGQRKANVWMAPGARPIGKGRAEAEKSDAEAKKQRRQAGAKPFGKPGGDRPRTRDSNERPRGRPPGKGPKAR